MNGPQLIQAQLSLHFEATAGGRTVLARRQVRYPQHITAPLAGQADAVLVVQSASGGLYGGEQLAQQVSLDAGARVTLRFPSASVVNACQGDAQARQQVQLHLGAQAALHYQQRPLILLPGARLQQSLQVWMAPGSQLLWSEGVTLHDPLASTQHGDPAHPLPTPPGPRQLDSRIAIHHADGRPWVIDRWRLDDALLQAAWPGVTGRFRAFGALWWLGGVRAGLLAHWRAAVQALDAGPAGSSVALSTLPQGAGVVFRLAATEGGALDATLATLKTLVSSDTGMAPNRLPGSPPGP